MTWVYSFIWAVLPFFTSNRYALEGSLTSCSFDYISRNHSNRIVIISMFIGGFFLPLITIALFYILIVFLLRKSEIYLTYQVRHNSFDKNQNNLNSFLNQNEKSKLIQENKKFYDSAVINYPESYSITKVKDLSPIYSKREMKLIKMVCLLILMYLVAWTPYAVVTLAAQLGSNIENYINPYTTSLPALFAKTSSVYNPLIYTLSNKDFRQFFISCFLKKFKLLKK